jgi:hypothetical protein
MTQPLLPKCDNLHARGSIMCMYCILENQGGLQAVMCTGSLEGSAGSAT